VGYILADRTNDHTYCIMCRLLFVW